MSTPTVSDYLKYVNLQMAAEAFLVYESGDAKGKVKADIKTALIDGNGHATRFTEIQAQAFVDQWEVVDQRANTKTGFSGTLFRNKANPNDLVLSFRSTEFIDDAIRDSAATNSLEVFDTGWAWGQMRDMETWYKELTGEKGALLGKTYSVTGYSLGGHLATAFNLLRREDGSIGNIDSVVTFNGAGVGQVKSGNTLTSALNEFKQLRGSQFAIAVCFTDTRLRAAYYTLSNQLRHGAPVTAEHYALINALGANPNDTDYQRKKFTDEKNWLTTALDRINAIQIEVSRLKFVTDSTQGQPAPIPNSRIAQESLDYQLAALKAAERTTAMSIPGGAINAIFGKSYGEPPLTNQYDIVGIETTTLWKEDRQKSAEERAAGNVNFSNRWIEDRGDKKLAANNNNWRQAA
ncbi:MAG: hypothetical protein L6Q60_01800 [Rhodocyclaceae bacterium]|nr:hypothetical protein [Rhodocyclaceae bacterium]